MTLTEDMNDMLGSLLGDPESMEQIKELADMLRAETSSAGGSSESGCSDGSSGGTPSGGAPSGGGGMNLSSLAGMLGGGINPQMLSAVSGVMAAVSGEDKNRALLLALRPHLSAEKQERVDKAVKMLKIYAAFNAIKDSGALGSLDKLL